MDKRQLGVYLIMKELGGFKIDDIEDRVFLQKSIYLLQLLGVDFRYRFSWYKRGPYSKTLSACSYEIDGNIRAFTDMEIKPTLRNEVLIEVNKIKTAISKMPKTPEMNKTRWLELIASIHYLKHIADSDPDSVDLERMKKKLSVAGKEFDDLKIVAAWGCLEELDLLNTKNHTLVLN